MSIESAITNAQGKVANAYVAISNKGGTLPATQNLSNMPTAISSIPEATEPTLASLTVLPSTTAQTLTPPSGTDGYNTVTVSAVTASIDSDIQAGNIRNGVNILGVTGNYSGGGSTPVIEALTVTPSTTTQTISVSAGTDGYSPVTVSAVDSSIDSDIQAGNIKDGVTILGVTGTYTGGSSFIGIPRAVVYGGEYKAPQTSFTFSLPSNATSVSNFALSRAFYNCTGLTSVDLSTVTTIGYAGLQEAFSGCVNLTSVDLSGLVRIVEGAMNTSFRGCTNLSGPLDLSNLNLVDGTSAMYDAFNGCKKLTSVDLSGLTTLTGNAAMYQAFKDCIKLTSADLSSLTSLSGPGVTATAVFCHAFQGCTSLTSVDLSGVTTVSGCVFFDTFGDSGLTNISFDNLTSVSGTSAMQSLCYSCLNLTSAYFPKLEIIGANTSTANNTQFGSAFFDCNNLTSITFPMLEKIYCTGNNSKSGTFYNNNTIQKFYFPKLNTITYGSGASSSSQTACKNIFYGCSALTELHFGAANQSAIEASPGYSTAWGRGAGNVTIYFDL